MSISPKNKSEYTRHGLAINPYLQVILFYNKSSQTRHFFISTLFYGEKSSIINLYFICFITLGMH